MGELVRCLLVQLGYLQNLECRMGRVVVEVVEVEVGGFNKVGLEIAGVVV